MGDFQLDTTGAVWVQSWGHSAVWSDLTPFAQGYVEAIFAEKHRGLSTSDRMGEHKPLGFSDLAPETLARIIADCADFTNYVGGLTSKTLIEREGARFWRHRKDDQLRGVWGAAFPPLTPTLRDGKVYFAEVAA